MIELTPEEKIKFQQFYCESEFYRYQQMIDKEIQLLVMTRDNLKDRYKINVMQFFSILILLSIILFYVTNSYLLSIICGIGSIAYTVCFLYYTFIYKEGI